MNLLLCFCRKLKCDEIYEIVVKPGWRKGTGKGHQEPGSAPTDLIFVVDERPHAFFKREGNDLVLIQQISLADALIGKTLNLTTLDGRNLTIQVTNIVKPDYVLIVPNEGMPIAEDPSKKGNLIIKFDVMFPSRHTLQQKRDLKGILSDTNY
jgi:DnaJ family protein B protein 4